LRAWHACTRTHHELIDPLELPQHFGSRDNNTGQSAVAHQEIRANAVPENRSIPVKFGQECRQIVNTRRDEEHFGGTTDAP
jgi:hypothetical protein